MIVLRLRNGNAIEIFAKHAFRKITLFDKSPFDILFVNVFNLLLFYLGVSILNQGLAGVHSDWAVKLSHFFVVP